MSKQDSKDQKQEAKDKKQNLIIAITLALAMIYLINWFSQHFYFNERGNQIASKEQDLSALETKRDSLENIKKNLDVLQKSSFDLEDDYKALSVLVPEEKDLPNILTYLHQAGVQRDLRLSHFSQSQKIARQGALNQVPITVSVLGSDDNISRYLTDFVRFNRILNLEGIKLVEETDPKYIGNMNAEIKFSAYVSDPISIAMTNQKLKN